MISISLVNRAKFFSRPEIVRPMPTLRALWSTTLVLVLLTTGCASYVNHLCYNISPSSTFVTVESTPPGALARFSDGRTTTTPCRVCLRSDEDITVDLTKDGYQPARIEIGPGFDAWYLGNFIAVPPFGFFVDVEQDAVMRSYPGSVHVELQSIALRRPGSAATPDVIK